MCNYDCLKFNESGKSCFGYDYHSKIYNCLLEDSLTSEDVLPERLSANIYKIITDLCFAICINYHLFLSHIQYHSYSIVTEALNIEKQVLNKEIHLR